MFPFSGNASIFPNNVGYVWIIGINIDIEVWIIMKIYAKFDNW